MAIIVLSPDRAHAQIDWNNNTGIAPKYEDGSNWIGGVAPGPADTARFNLAGAYEVHWNNGTTASRPGVGFLQVLQGDVTFLNLNAAPQHKLFIVGSGGGGAFSDFSISVASTSLTLSGLHMHSLGGAEIINGGTLTLDGSHTAGANLTVDGIGLAVDGNFNVQSGGIATSTNSFVGRAAAGTGVATVTGTGSQWNSSGFLSVGEFGNGTLNIQDGGVVAANFGYVGFGAGSTGVATVTGAGSQWNNATGMEVGTFGNGTLNIEAGGTVNSTNSNIALEAGSIGMATVTGAGSQWNNSNLYLGGGAAASGGSGSLTIADSGAVSVTGTTKLWSGGTLNLNGGSLTTGTFDNTSGGTFNFNDGTLTVSGIGDTFNPGTPSFTINGNTATANPTLEIANTATVTLTGDLTVGSTSQGGLRVFSGGVVSNVNGWIGNSNGSTGVATVTGAGSQWNNSGNLYLGGTDTTDGGVATLSIQDSGQINVGNNAFTSTGAALTVSDIAGTGGNLWVRNGSTITNSGAGFIGLDSGSTGVATVTGAGSQWNNSGGLWVGQFGNGTLDVLDGGVVTVSLSSRVGHRFGSTGVVTVDGANSRWNAQGLQVGGFGNGTLNIQTGGVVNATSVELAVDWPAFGAATVTGNGSQLNSTGSIVVGDDGNGTLNVASGGSVSSVSGAIALDLGSTGQVTVNGAGSQWNNSGSLTVGGGGNATLNVQAGGVVSNTNGVVANAGSFGPSVVTVTGVGSQWNNSFNLTVGRVGNGTLNVEAGGVVSSQSGLIGEFSVPTGSATVTGVGSQWNNSGNLYLGGTDTTDGGVATLSIQDSGQINVGNNAFTSTGAALTVSDIAGTGGNLWVRNGSTITNSGAGFIGLDSGSTGVATVTGAGSKWNNSGDLNIAPAGTGTLNIADSGLVTVGGTTTVGANGTVNLTGGRLEFGRTDATSYGRISGTSGSLAGSVDLFGYNDIQSLPGYTVANLDTSEVQHGNHGVIYGAGVSTQGLTNFSDGELRTLSGEWARFGGTGGTNAGEFNNFGGIIEFEQDLTNLSGGFIGGRGQFIANGGWTNEGVMAFSAGPADVLGDVQNIAGGQIVTSGFATTTFFDDVIHNGAEIRTAAGSGTVIFGAASGAGSYTGTGTVFFEGDLRPGNSPGVIDFAGDVVFGSSLTSQFELGGTLLGEFDQLDIEGDLFLDGLLEVDLISGFELGFNQEFLIADVNGTLSGSFFGLGEGDLVGNFGGQDLFISYSRGNGNDVALFTSVPEPGTAGLLGLAMLGLAMRRQRRDRV